MATSRAQLHRAGRHLAAPDLSCQECRADAFRLADAFPAERAAIRPVATGPAYIPGRLAATFERS
jgi:hypothetical protein